jgi:N-acylneuraminate cytidylyltransferase
MRIVSIILARGGSKGIPKKNIIDFCGKPLIEWSIRQCLEVKAIESVWVSSDSDEILSIASSCGAKTIVRPDNISGDKATSESSWLHAIDYIEGVSEKVDLVVAPQVTSPLRESTDIDAAIDIFSKNGLDSLFSCSLAEDLYFWQKDENGNLESMNYDWRNRKRRQDHAAQYIENGSFYLFTPDTLRRFNNRFGEKIGMCSMEFWKAFEIDSLESFRLCKALMREYISG